MTEKQCKWKEVTKKVGKGVLKHAVMGSPLIMFFGTMMVAMTFNLSYPIAAAVGTALGGIPLPIAFCVLKTRDKLNLNHKEENSNGGRSPMYIDRLNINTDEYQNEHKIGVFERSQKVIERQSVKFDPKDFCEKLNREERGGRL